MTFAEARRTAFDLAVANGETCAIEVEAWHHHRSGSDETTFTVTRFATRGLDACERFSAPTMAGALAQYVASFARSASAAAEAETVGEVTP